MGQMTLSEFQSELTFEMGNDSEIESYRTDWINRAARTLTTQDQFFGKDISLYFPELETSSTTTTADGTATLTTPTTAHFVRTLWESTSDIKMTNISWSDYIERTGRAVEASRGAPTMWVRRGTNLYLYYTPDGAYGVTIYFKKYITELSAAGDVLEIGEEWDEAVLKLCVIQSMYRRKRYADAEKEEGIFLNMVSGIASGYDNETMDREDRRYPDRTWIFNDY
jgi:hypothetical protein